MPLSTDKPFNGAWDVLDWPPLDPAKVREPKKGRTQYQICARLEPEGDLKEFGQKVAEITGMTIAKELRDSDKSICLYLLLSHKNPRRALSLAEFTINRIVKKTGFTLRRLSYDVMPVS